MLVIRMQRTGRKGHAQFRVVVQDSRRTPTSGKIVAQIGHFNPHSKETVIDKEKAALYMKNGAQPSDRVARLLKSEGVKLPSWVQLESKKQGQIRHAEKLRRNRPDEPKKEVVTEAPADEAAPEEVAEAPAEESTSDEVASTEQATETPEAEAATEEPAVEAAAEEVAAAEEPEASEAQPSTSSEDDSTAEVATAENPETEAPA